MRFMNHSTGQFGSPVSSLVLHLPATSPAQPPRSCLLGFCRTQRVWGRGAGRDGTFFSPAPGRPAAAGPAAAVPPPLRGRWAAPPARPRCCPRSTWQSKPFTGERVYAYIHTNICVYVCILRLTGIQPLLLCCCSTHSSLLNPKWFNQNDVYPT